jgi:hypothetical protein
MEVSILGLNGTEAVVALIGLLAALFNWGPSTTQWLIKIIRKLDIPAFFSQQVLPRVPSKQTANKFLYILALLALLFPSLLRKLPDVLPDFDIDPEPAPVAVEVDFVDKCHETYRKLLADVYEDFSARDLTDPDTYDDFEARRLAVYKASYEKWNAVVQDAVRDGSLGTLAEDLRQRKVTE